MVNAGFPPGLPSAMDALSELSEPLRRHFNEARVRTEGPDADEMPEEGNFASRDSFVAFISARIRDEDHEIHEQKVARSIRYEETDAETRRLLDEARRTEWAKFERFAATVPVTGTEKEKLLSEGHVVIPSQWVDVDKNEHLKGKPDYTPKMKSRLVSCGNFERERRD